MKTRIHKSSAGFTLLEIMLVVAIIAVLAGTAVYLMGGNLGYAQDVKAKTDIQTITTQLMLYKAMNGNSPSTQQGLQALVTQPTGDPAPTSWRQLLPQLPQDPWHNPYYYAYPGTHNQDYDLYSAGNDGKPNTADDVGNWDNNGQTQGQ
ncbi:MAG: type II secretion system major pseudopilin GspG [Chthoniobacteraceae bacterium]